MKKQTAVCFVCMCFLLLLVGCRSQYTAEEVIGKTSAQIEAGYGTFDCCLEPAGADGLYRNTACGYTIKEARVSFLGTVPETLLFISFDETGVACDAYEGHRPGG